MEPLLRFLTSHLVETAITVFVGVSILRAVFQAATQDPSKRHPTPRMPRPAPPATTAAPATIEDELRERVRRGFEEMMRRRATAPTPATENVAPRHVVKRQAPTEAVVPTPRAPRAAVFAAASAAPARLARQRIARRAGTSDVAMSTGATLRNPDALRHALLMREILDAPIALRAPR